jgi:peptide/nickel transport system ATP-binding protein
VLGRDAAACRASGRPALALHPLEHALTASLARQESPVTAPMLRVRGLKKYFGRSDRPVRAVDDVSFEIAKGEVLGLVGESGSGKTTVGRSVLKLIDPTAGQVWFEGSDLAPLSAREMRPYRRRLQIIFQDPYASLNPRRRVGDTLDEAMATHGLHRGAARPERIAELLSLVGLAPEHARRFPHEFSGGQRQRIGIARALAVEPQLIVADEPVSALDVSIQAQVINLLSDLRERFGLTMLFISHDLDVIEYLCDRIVVLYLGKVMEVAPAKALYKAPKHPYTEALLEASPRPDPDARRDRRLLQGDIPSPVDPPSGCVFRTRCPYALEACAAAVPALREVEPGRFKACIRDDIL